MRVAASDALLISSTKLKALSTDDPTRSVACEVLSVSLCTYKPYEVNIAFSSDDIMLPSTVRELCDFCEVSSVSSALSGSSVACRPTKNGIRAGFLSDAGVSCWHD
jgi:hypothetical protein